MKAILIDDDQPTLFILNKMLAKIPRVEIVGEFLNAGDAYHFLKHNPVELAFVDIKMPGESGLDFAWRSLAEFPDLYVVFLTAYKDYAVEAFEVQAFDYIVKPIQQERLERTVSRVLQRKAAGISSRNTVEQAKVLFVYCLGGLDLRNTNDDFVMISSSKGQELFAYLLVHRERLTSKWRIMEDVFQGMSPQNAETYLNTTVYKLRKVLEQYGKRSAIVVASESYVMEIKDFYIDFIEFENKVRTLPSITEANLQEAIQTFHLFAGELFGDKDYQWSLAEKERLGDIYCSFAKKLGRYLLENQNSALALQVFKKLVAINELDEESHCFLLQVYAAQNDLPSLIRHYDRYVQLLQRELAISPSNRTAQLFLSLKKSLL
ncbi:response regulator receiver and SARP domain protein [Desulfitobacterium sp. LBE]|uniref:Stage 0 sporulation protein A homolog n=5 Tax=root TaxID=1 RepID=Q24R15_DESHY|nr:MULTISPECIES: response regulator [Desulfitobacterium]ACL19662.1 response regulator receiver and SARP domain protein [Desulfitobacterium hafniense DCB-2]EHL08348.1 response regulator receiver domain protein [Desulfitobacterium hafniense DP7]KTE89651.1 histidine kinase [Desulfitobacterium hafniense]MEA5024479.1 response regulator [Desulfitobacterium hafniense]TWH57488.1 response regulator receiver and SARP domain protein [Desulfitobacterium sp. LBE]